MVNNSTSIIMVQGLNLISSAGRPLVRNLNLQLGKESVALVGESGSGKSLTAKALMGLLAPSIQCQVQTLNINGQSLVNASEQQWRKLRGRKLAMVLQDPKYALNPARTIGWQVDEVLKLHQRLSRSERRERVLSMLESVGLPEPHHYYHYYPHQLSGGMGQRVMLAIALINQPDYLIADEPTSALDQAMRAQVLALIHRLVDERNMGLLLISHDLQQVAEYRQRVVVMYKGQLLDELSAKNLPDATHPYTRTLWSCRPSAATKGRPLPVLDPVLLEGYLQHD
jgi:peptide/nickel transport system ATP-binding protein